MSIANPSSAPKGWRAFLALERRVAIGRWLNDAGRNLGVWVAPEIPEIDAVMQAAEAEQLIRPVDETATVAAVKDFVFQENAR